MASSLLHLLKNFACSSTISESETSFDFSGIEIFMMMLVKIIPTFQSQILQTTEFMEGGGVYNLCFFNYQSNPAGEP